MSCCRQVEYSVHDGVPGLTVFCRNATWTPIELSRVASRLRTRPVTRGVLWVRTNPPLSRECNLPEGFPLCCGELAAKYYIVSARARAVCSVTRTLLYSDCTSLGMRPVSYPDGLRISWGATPRVLVPYRPARAVSKEQSGTERYEAATKKVREDSDTGE